MLPLLSFFLWIGLNGPGDLIAAETPSLPPDLKHYGEKAELCIHFSGEEPYDAARRKEIEAGVKKNCTGLKETERSLRTKYKNDPKATAYLDGVAAKNRAAFGEP